MFKYLGQFLAFGDNNACTMKSNLCKAWKCWARVLRVLWSENAPPQVCCMFYKTTVQAALLFGSETWNALTAILAQLEGFHIRAVYCMVQQHKPEWTPNSWVYPLSKDMLEEVGLYTM